jgi:DNA-binding transcriptional LysR family regulator
VETTALHDLNVRYLYEAARLGSMRAAADRLGVAVSSISRQISQLEAELGVALIEHGRRSLLLTEAGKLLIDYYSEQLTHRESFEARLADLKGLRTGRLSLAIGEGFIGAQLAGLVSRFVAKHRGILLDVRVMASSSEVARLVLEDEAHLGLAFQASDDPRIRVLASVRHPLCAIMRPTHPLAKQQRVTLAELALHPMCLPESSFRTRQLIKVAEVAERVFLQPSVTSNSLALLKTLLCSGELLTLLPMLAVSEEVERGAFVAIPVQSAALEDTSVHLIGRLGRHLTPAPLRLLNSLMSYLNGYERCLERSRLSSAASSDPGRHDMSRAPRADTG